MKAFANFDGKLSHKSITRTNINQKDWIMNEIIQPMIKVLQYFLKEIIDKVSSLNMTNRNIC